MPSIPRVHWLMALVTIGLLPAVLSAQTGTEPVRSATDPVPPFHTQGVQILDAANRPVHLYSVNWYGFDQKEFVAGGLDKVALPQLAHTIRSLGFNSVRLPWANETLEKDPVIADYALKANPQLRGKHAMEIMDEVIAALAKEHIFVVLDNHMSDADWCCSLTDENGLWYNARYSEGQWLKDWQTLVRRYRNQPYVVGADLRNELRSPAVWGGGDAKTDWHRAAELGGNAILSTNPNLLIMVEGISYSNDLRGIASLPVQLTVADRVVYSPHDYPFQHENLTSYDQLAKRLDAAWGFILHMSRPAPVWVGEFGICQDLTGCMADGKPIGQWLPWFLEYVEKNQLNWSYWSINGTESSGRGRTFGLPESYAILDPTWQHAASPMVVVMLRASQAH